MHPLHQLVDSFADLTREMPVEDTTEVIRTFLNENLAKRFQDLDLGNFCQYLLDHLKEESLLAGLVVALRDMTDHLSLHTGEYLAAEKIQAKLLKYNLLQELSDGRLVTADGVDTAEIFFGACSYLLLNGYLLTEIEGQKFKQFSLAQATEELIVTGVFQFKDGQLPVIDSRIQKNFGHVEIASFFGQVINRQCYGVAKSGDNYYLISENQIVGKTNLIVTDCLALALNESGTMRAIIQTYNAKTKTYINHFIDDNKIQKTCGDVNIANLSNMEIDPQGNITGLIPNPRLPGTRIVKRHNSEGQLYEEELPYLLPFTNGQLLDEVAERTIDTIVEAGFYKGKSYGKFIIAGREGFILADKLVKKIAGVSIVDCVIDDNFSDLGTGLIVLSDDSWIQLNRGKIVEKINDQEVYNYRDISTTNNYPHPSGFFFDGVNWLLVLNGNVKDCPAMEPGFDSSFNVEAREYLAEVGPSGKLTYAGLIDFTEANDPTKSYSRHMLIINGEELKPVEFAGKLRNFTTYSDLSFNYLGSVFCELEADDGTVAYYANGEFLDPEDYYLLPTLCLSKEEIVQYLKANTDLFNQDETIEISDVQNYRLGFDNQRYFTCKCNERNTIVMGNVILLEDETTKDLLLDVSEPGSQQLQFTSKGILQNYGYMPAGD